jgi:hypothetical protein
MGLRKIEELPDTQHNQRDHAPNDRHADKLCHENQDWNSDERENRQENETDETSDRVHRTTSTKINTQIASCWFPPVFR